MVHFSAIWNERIKPGIKGYFDVISNEFFFFIYTVVDLEVIGPGFSHISSWSRSNYSPLIIHEKIDNNYQWLNIDFRDKIISLS